MMNKIAIWSTITLIISAFVFPTIYVIFSIWWLLTGDMVTRLTFFTTGSISITLIIVLLLLTNVKRKITYITGNRQIEKIKEMFNL